MNTEKHLDQQIKEALEKLKANNDGLGLAWQAFEQRLDQDAANVDATFDEVVSGKLQAMDVPLASGDWGRMEKMIEAEETAEQLENEAGVDNLLTEKLERLETAFQPQHWQMMAHRLEEEFFVRYHLLRCKAAEVGLVLLLLLTIVRFMPVADGRLEKDNSTNWPVPLTPDKVPVENPKSSITPAIVDISVPVVASDANNRQQRAAFQKNSTSKAPNGVLALGEPTFQNNLPPTASPHESHFDKSAASLSYLGLSPVFSNKRAVSLFEIVTANKFIKNTLRTPGVDPDMSKNGVLTASLSPYAGKSKYAWEVPQMPQYAIRRQRQLRLNIFTTTDVAYVVSPANKYSVFDSLVASGQDTTLASGYGGGIGVSLKKGKWEFHTGGIYSFKRYIPNTPVILFETVNYYRKEEFKGVQLDILQVPLNVSYHFKDQGKWRIYGLLGSSGHFVTTSAYETNNSSRELSPRALALLPVPSSISKSSEPIAESKGLPDGLFDGGSIYDNFYLTANLGLGMERYFSSRWSLFLQPNYQHHFLTNGIGVNGEKLYNFSFNFGTKVSLK